jgi:hypothetical protein
MKKLTTLFLYTATEEDPVFFELEGDYSDLNGVYINSTGSHDKLDKLNEVLFDEDGNFLQKKLTEPTKDWTWFAMVGFIY